MIKETKIQNTKQIVTSKSGTNGVQNTMNWTTYLQMSLIAYLNTFLLLFVKQVVPYTSPIPFAFQCSLDRHLTKELHKSFSITQDIQFAPSHEKLKAARKWLKGQGKGNKPNAAEALEPLDIQKFWDEGALARDDPDQLQQTLLWLTSTHMGTRGCDEHHKFQLGDFTIKSSPDGEYIEFSAEKGTKTRSGETVKSTNASVRSFKPKMWATPENPLKCPAAIFHSILTTTNMYG